MRIVTRVLLPLLMIMSVVSCKRTLKPEEIPAHIVKGDTYYTQFVIRYEKGTHVTTNYRRGAAIPVNTPVRLLDITSQTIEVAPDNSSRNLVIKNVEKHTGDDIFAAFDKLFAKSKVDLAQFTRLERQNIQSGTVAKGMRKKAVVVAIGYPPVTETMNLDSNLWVYWSGRFNKFNVYFKNGKVSRIED